MYFEAPPGLQLLHCLQNSVIGGQSLFHDVFGSVERLQKLHPKEYEILSTVPVTFHYENDGRHFEYLRPTISRDLNDSYRIYYAPPFQGPLRCRPEQIKDFYDAFAVFESLIQEEQYKYRYLMKEGDCAIFANRRVLHAREAFDPKSGDRWLRGTYVGWDEVKDRVRSCL